MKINRDLARDGRRGFRREPRAVPIGTAFLVSALMIYPAFTAVSVDLDRQTMRFDFQFDLRANKRTRDLETRIFSRLMHTVEYGVNFAQQLIGIKPLISVWQQQRIGHLYSATWERDLGTLAEREVDVLHELLIDFCIERELELEEGQMDGEQFLQFEQVFDELFQQVQEMDPSTRLRAYRDMGMIYVHRLPSTEGNG